MSDLDFYGNVIGDDGVKAIATSENMSKLRKLSLYGNLVEDEGAIAIAESKTLSKLKHLFMTSNRVRRKGLEALQKSKSRTRLCHLYLDDIEDFMYPEDFDDDEDASSWDELEGQGNKSGIDDSED